MMKKHKNRTGENGFTLVEVMVAITVFMIALVGLVALQKVSMSAGSMGRDHTAATNLARYVMTWLQNEAASFPQDVNNANLNGTDYPLLNQGLADAVDLGTSFKWHALDDGVAALRFDTHLGTSAEAHYAGGVDSAKFCVQYSIGRFTAGQTDPSADDQKIPEVYQAIVRVSWPKEGLIPSDWKNCSARTNSNISNYHSIELAGLVTREFSCKVQ